MTRSPIDQGGDAFHLHPEETSQDRDVLDPIFKAGVEARAAGLPMDHNPYAAGSEQRREWDAGWCATVEIEDSDDGLGGAAAHI